MDQTALEQPCVRPARRGYAIAKRMMDLAVCVAALPFLLPVMAVIGVLVRLDSPGPAIFVQVRVGKGGRRFGMYKFRTLPHGLDDAVHKRFMRAYVSGEIDDDSAPEAMYKPLSRSQITRLGRILRKTSMDELPQVLNVLKGEMSLVGPRPNVPWEVDAYLPWHRQRLAVLPGITGLAQVNGRSCISFDDLVRYDIQYIKAQSLWLDLKILWQTVPSVLAERGAR